MMSEAMRNLNLRPQNGSEVAVKQSRKMYTFLNQNRQWQKPRSTCTTLSDDMDKQCAYVHVFQHIASRDSAWMWKALLLF